MVDALSPAVEALTSRRSAGSAAEALLRRGAPTDGAQSTASITAKRGRASYVGEASRGVLAPGAVARALMIERQRRRARLSRARGQHVDRHAGGRVR